MEADTTSDQAKALKEGERLFDKLVRDHNLSGSIKTLPNHDLCKLGEYVKTLPPSPSGDSGASGGVPALMGAVVAAEKIRRWDDRYVTEVMGENYAAGATTAEGLDSGMRGEEI